MVFFQVSKHSKRGVVARFRMCPCLPKQPPEPRQSYPPQLCVAYADLWLDAMTSLRRKVKCARLKRIQGSAWIKSASIKRICVSAAEAKERRQGSRKRAPRWRLAAAKPDFVLGSRLGINWTPAMGLHRHGARQRHRCVRTHSFVLGKQISRVHR